MKIEVDVPEAVEIPGVARAAQVRVRDQDMEGAIATADLLTRRRLKGLTITILDASWLVTEANVSAAVVTFAGRRTDNG